MINEYQRELKAWKQRKKAWEKEKRKTLEGLKEMLVYGYPEPKPTIIYKTVSLSELSEIEKELDARSGEPEIIYI